MLLSLLIYGYATGCYSSRKIERATYDSLAFRFIACNLHPDHDTLARFRQRFNEQFKMTFVQVLEVARENQLSRFGTVSLDGTKLHANASRHSALSYGHAEKIQAQLQAEVEALFELAGRADGSGVPDGMSLPEELKRREDRLAAIAEAKTKIAARAQERFLREQADYEAKLAAREALRRGQWQEAWRQGPQAAAARRACRGPDQPHRRGVAHHAGRWRGLRAVLQRPSGRRHRHPVGAGPLRHPGGQRQGAGRADGRESSPPRG
jgi:hypothetical protein